MTFPNLTEGVVGSRVLVVDDERNVRDMLQLGLERQGFAVRSLPDGRQLASVIDEWQPQAVVLDVMLPYADGFALLPLIRRRTEAPVIMLTAKSDVGDRVTGLELGADDYLPKPFALAELIARIVAALRRPHIKTPTELRYADLVVDRATREVRRGSRKISLSNREFTLLLTLLREPKRIFSKEQLLDMVWGRDFEGDIGNVETYISYLRAKIDAASQKKLIHTVRGAGYTLKAVEAEDET